MLSALGSCAGQPPAKEVHNVQTYNSLSILLPWVRNWQSLGDQQTRAEWQQLAYIAAIAEQQREAAEAEVARTRIVALSVPETPIQSVAPNQVIAEFLSGYRAEGGPPQYEEHFVDIVIPHESGGNPNADNHSGHRGLTQFSESTWENLMDVPYFPNVFDPYQHGRAAARLVLYILRTPGSTFRGQWSTW